ncbi:uncharacterized protein LOC132719872 [Ruditapes philippinarum]|uniref:uncharacterized protein LOC132719872 n=1 Tax=Ruditapes philippinarum TaxID=129788 RepID=UPI00295A6705|nr:uncharacterized protein LOC132719872 [Ruditapes philippinarum]
MFKKESHTEEFSLMMSQVLSDIGVNERIVLKRRQAWLLNECMDTKSRQLFGNNTYVYFLGSQSEGTTTRGINSDVDQLICMNDFHVIEDLKDWQPGVHNLLMIQDEEEEQGYCKLQCFEDNAPVPCSNVPNEHFVKMGKTGKVLMKNNLLYRLAKSLHGLSGNRHGPAYSVHMKGFLEKDVVHAFPLKTWPSQARQWLNKEGRWPTHDMRNYCSRTICFVVGVGRKDSETEALEWRISTSLAERCLMFNLNITQIRCYVLMKFILNTFIKPQFGDIISSYMCKTILFHCIANTENVHSDVWNERNLLICLTKCLFVLYTCIQSEKCPHFISPVNNLMKGKILAEIKPNLLKNLKSIIKSNGKELLKIECDGFGVKLQIKMKILPMDYIPTLNEIISGYLTTTTARFIDVSTWPFLIAQRNRSCKEIIQILSKYISSLVNDHNQALEKKACGLLAAKFSEFLGSALASLSIQEQRAVSQNALGWISASLNTDVASSKLKLASVFYCTGDYNNAESILLGTEKDYDLDSVQGICSCYSFVCKPPRTKFDDVSFRHGVEAIQTIVALCVRFFKNEINCAPNEIKYEMFRSTKEDMSSRQKEDHWMDSAVVDSLPFLYFLQYKTYKKLGKVEDKQRALSNLEDTIRKESNLGHRETALNLLGQCKEEEDQPTEALHNYILSLIQRRRNNAASIHICRLLSKMINNT